jgi:hypothetical protein
MRKYKKIGGIIFNSAQDTWFTVFMQGIGSGSEKIERKTSGPRI